MSQNELFHDACVIIEQAQKSAYLAVNETLIKRNWLLGMRIQHEVLKDQRAEYGKQLVRKLSILLVGRYDNSFSERNLYHFIDFYRLFPDFFYAVSGKPAEEQFVNTMSSQLMESKNEILNSLRSKTPVTQSDAKGSFRFASLFAYRSNAWRQNRAGANGV